MRQDLPGGSVTLVFTDVEGSTRLLDELGTVAYAQALADHRRALRDAFARHGGVEVDTQGDSFFYAFASAEEALQAAGAGQEALSSGPIRVRMGLHTGTPHLAEEGYVGHDVHLAARIAASAHGGQVVLSSETRALLGPPGAVSVADLGEHRLKDVAAPVWLYQLGGKGFPPLRTISNTNLPRPASSFVGREREMSELVPLLRDGARLLTLSGPGGSGKTRLAIEVASDLVTDFKSGVFWVGLAALRDPALVTATIATALGAKDTLREHIGDRELLLLLDNLEQVIACADELADLVETCPNLSLLVTSRERLRVRGEVDYSVPPLSAGDAVNLFCRRTRLEADATIAELCGRLDNLPLTVELAAARTGVLSPAQILGRLAQRLDLLRGGRDSEARQQTLRATIEWSHDLLMPAEQRLFARLSVFAGGCTLTAADEVLDADLNMLQSLVDKSLLRFTSERFWLLETIRDYALERAAESGSAAELRSRHAKYFTSFAEAAELELERSEQAVWLDRIEADLDNIRGALDWSFSDGDSVLGTRILGALVRFWLVRGHALEEERWIDRALASSSELPAELDAKLLKVAAANASFLRKNERCKRLTERRLALAGERGDASEEAACLNNLALVAEAEEDFEQAAALLRRAVAGFRQVGRRVDVPLNNLSRVTARLGDIEASEELASEALSIARDSGDLEQVLDITQWMSWLSIRQDRIPEALRRQREGVELAVRLQSKFHFRICCENLAFIVASQGDVERSAQLFEKAQALRREIGLPPWTPETDRLNTQTYALLRAGLEEGALHEAMSVGRNAGVRDLLETALEQASVAAELADRRS
jgi:predicted ATPase/class 3 adenylate cyclase